MVGDGLGRSFSFSSHEGKERLTFQRGPRMPFDRAAARTATFPAATELALSPSGSASRLGVCFVWSYCAVPGQTSLFTSRRKKTCEEPKECEEFCS